MVAISFGLSLLQRSEATSASRRLRSRAGVRELCGAVGIHRKCCCAAQECEVVGEVGPKKIEDPHFPISKPSFPDTGLIDTVPAAQVTGS